MTGPTPQPPSAPEARSPQIHTYHCLCSHLLLASTHPLSALPRRSANSLDKAYILPLPPPPSTSSSSSDEESEAEDAPAAHNTDPATRRQKGGKSNSYALLLSTFLDKKPVIVRRSDGFEKRWMQRCGRCKVGIGYQLDWGQFAGAGGAKGGSNRTGRREDVVYLLPGGLVATEAMVEGTSPEKAEWEKA